MTPRKKAQPVVEHEELTVEFDNEAPEIIRGLIQVIETLHTRYYPGTHLPGYPAMERARKYLAAVDKPADNE